jgi:hypothetical protein
VRMNGSQVRIIVVLWVFVSLVLCGGSLGSCSERSFLMSIRLTVLAADHCKWKFRTEMMMDTGSCLSSSALSSNSAAFSPKPKRYCDVMADLSSDCQYCELNPAKIVVNVLSASRALLFA